MSKTKFPTSIMQPVALGTGAFRGDFPARVGRIDGAAVQAAYTRLEPDDTSPESLGPWNTTSFHLRGDMGSGVAFGTSYRNGLARPWGYGIRPQIPLERNRALSGSVVWNGALLGFTPRAHTVSGAARIGINIGTMAGHVDFTGLKSWGTLAVPGGTGQGVTWKTGSLRYSIVSSGYGFLKNGGDEGDLRGYIVGRSHEGVVGTLERRDLSAAFGAKR